METAEFDNVTVLPVDKYRIFKILDQLGWGYDSIQGFIYVIFDEGYVGFSLGESNELVAFGFSETSAERPLTDLLEIVNTWNTQRRWPTVVVSTYDNGYRIAAQHYHKLSDGVTDSYLADIIKRSVHAIMRCNREFLKPIFLESHPSHTIIPRYSDKARKGTKVLDNTIALPITRYRLLQAFDEIGWLYQVRKNRFLLEFQEGRVMVTLEGDNVLSVFTHTDVSPAYTFSELLEIANTWNSKYRWPAVSVFADTDGLQLIATQSIDLEAGITDKSLVYTVSQQVRSTMKCIAEVLAKVSETKD